MIPISLGTDTEAACLRTTSRWTVGDPEVVGRRVGSHSPSVPLGSGEAAVAPVREDRAGGSRLGSRPIGVIPESAVR